MFFPVSNRTLAGLLLSAALGLAAPAAQALDAKAKTIAAKTAAAKSAAARNKPAATKNKAAAKAADKKAGNGKSTSLGTFGEWGVFQTAGKAKTCYALAQPKKREPATLKRDAAYIFISTRPEENVKNEISIIMGFPMKDSSEASADIGSASFGLIAKGANAWVKNPAEEGHFIGAMKKGGKLIVTATSAKGKESTDTYALAGLAQALDRIRKECP